MIDNAILLETEVNLCAEKCAQFHKDNGVDDPDLLVEYGKALFKMAKGTASLVNPEKNQEPLKLVNPDIELPESDDDAPEVGSENETEGTGSKDEVINEGELDREEEEEDDFTAAFEILDAARVLYSKMDQTDEVKRKMIFVRQLLGDVSLEDDNPQQAVEDLTAALELKKSVYGEESGELTNTEYTLSLAYDALLKPKESITHLRNAVNCAKKAKLPSAETLELKLKDTEEEFKANKRIKQDGKMAKAATLEGIVGRQAVEAAMKSFVAGATDISNLTRKRKRPENVGSSKEAKTK